MITPGEVLAALEALVVAVMATALMALELIILLAQAELISAVVAEAVVGVMLRIPLYQELTVAPV